MTLDVDCKAEDEDDTLEIDDAGESAATDTKAECAVEPIPGESPPLSSTLLLTPEPALPPKPSDPNDTSKCVSNAVDGMTTPVSVSSVADLVLRPGAPGAPMARPGGPGRTEDERLLATGTDDIGGDVTGTSVRGSGMKPFELPKVSDIPVFRYAAGIPSDICDADDVGAALSAAAICKAAAC